jgi:hypothetical protein
MSVLSFLGFLTTEERQQKIEQRLLAQEERQQAIKDAQKKEAEDLPIFQVGSTADGRITLRLGAYNMATVTMSDAGVEQLIAMLAAAKGKYGEDIADIKDDEE